jgi:SAM-dependent methyltransferase
MLKRGWRVVPIEPSDALRHQLQQRLGISARSGGFEEFDSPNGAYDAIIGESVFYGMNLKKAFEKVHRLLRPGGLLASLDTVWTSAAKVDEVATIHDQTKKMFGIPMASREALTWADWRRILTEAGFVPVVEKQIPPGSLKADTGTKWTILRAALRHPAAFLQNLNHRRQFGALTVPPGWTETWMAVWRRV